jgi:hypothetical protein
VLSGDWKQTLPIVPHGTATDILNSCIKASPLWHLFHQFRLQTNMRMSGDPAWFNELERIGHGGDVNEEHLPQLVDSLEELIDFIHGNESENDEMKAILTPKNCDIREVNSIVLGRSSQPEIIYRGYDEVCPETPIEISHEFLNAQTHSGMALFELKLKKHCPVMLLRNLNPSEGLSNGTLMEVLNGERNVLHVRILSGPFKENEHFIPRIKMQSDIYKLPFKFSRIQFPVVLAYAITINNSQGQTFDKVGIYLKHNVFGHGQLYVALSLARQKSNIWIKRPDNEHVVNVVTAPIFQSTLF